MSRIREVFSARRAASRKALVTFHVLGFPSLEESVALAIASAEAGADLLELGVPFSDPTADGVAIARASAAAIRAGGGIAAAFDAAARVRAATSAPIVLFGYLNPLVVFGEARALSLGAEAGIDGLLVVDLPAEEATPLVARAAEAGLFVVPLVAPTTSPERVARLAASRAELEASLGPSGRSAALSEGFAYLVSTTGVTGGRAAGLEAAAARAAFLRASLGCPVVVGFGVDGPEAARRAAGPPGEGADGVVVGSELVRRIERAGSPATRLEATRSFVTDLRRALDEPG